MAEFDLDLESIERNIETAEERRVELGVLDGSTPAEEWIEAVGHGHVLVLAIEGELADHAEGFAGEIRDAGGELVHFREFLIVTPPDFEVDTERLN